LTNYNKESKTGLFEKRTFADFQKFVLWDKNEVGFQFSFTSDDELYVTLPASNVPVPFSTILERYKMLTDT
jgi:hypothetical protein